MKIVKTRWWSFSVYVVSIGDLTMNLESLSVEESDAVRSSEV